jgi:hypothetical protein
MKLNPNNTTGTVVSSTLGNSSTLLSNGNTSLGTSYPGTSYTHNHLEINGPIIYRSDTTTYSQSYLHEVAVIAITRSPEGSIIKSKMVKTMWVETKDGGSIDFAAGKDPEVGKFEPEDIIIKTLRTIKL